MDLPSKILTDRNLQNSHRSLGKGAIIHGQQRKQRMAAINKQLKFAGKDNIFDFIYNYPDNSKILDVSFIFLLL